MGELASALDALAADDLDGLSDGELLDRVRELAVAEHRITAALTRTVRRAEVRQAAEHDGLTSMRPWLTGHARLSGAAASRLLAQGRALDRLPAVEAAYAAGRLGDDAVDVLAEITRPENLDKAAAQGVDLPAMEAALLDVAVGGTHRQLQSAVGHYLAALDPDGPEPDPTEGRALTLSSHPDGSWTLGGALDTVGGEKVATALESIAAASRCAGETRTRAQRLGDALVQLCDLALASGQLPILRKVQPHVLVTVGLTELADPALGPGAACTALGATLSAARARWAACDAQLTRLVLDPDGLPLDVGRRPLRRGPPRAERVAGGAGVLSFAGCTAPHWWCDVHHLVEWIQGGETSLDNSGLLCERHHTKVHHGFRVERDDTAPPGARWRTYRPDVTEILLTAPLRV
ncbi:DUF222 domain-containing protein [Geodermatophilus sp. YIM 151500]|uniref:HNH endonuclease n=1 Tax=Geodermatophilus sp. YIM 151500 TaxID=2984531 RepID=UPI0021E3CA21|nr:HNH endonuclease [Geodermatophilus sp. YIM 151500]MCV2491362.1 DUF222 domain-containing protein [Geodermatophilus sp. YIM 151500]